VKLLISPHNDDETLFSAFTIMKEKPLVVVVFDSYVQVRRGNAGATADRRRRETYNALCHLQVSSDPIFLGLRDDAPDYEYLRSQLKVMRDTGQFDGLICPAWEQDGHEQHNGIARICRDIWPDEQRTEYLTYTRTHGRSRGVRDEAEGITRPVVEVIPTPGMIARKHRALACYSSQMEVENCRDWFLNDIREYAILPPAKDDAGRGVYAGGPK
jgi:LmbE family N-acetylglucosaminyl deacetylase